MLLGRGVVLQRERQAVGRSAPRAAPAPPQVADKLPANTTAHEKAATYGWYNIPHPSHNTGANQTCELDHLVSLELGGADSLINLWPECGPDGVALAERFFKQKDIVENYLAAEVKAGRMNLADVQKGIATDWTQYLDDAKAHCPGGNCP
jgi:hypothetical protein